MPSDLRCGPATPRLLHAAPCWSQVEASIQEALSGLAQGLASLEQQLSEAGTSEAQLNARLEKWTGVCTSAPLQCRQCNSNRQAL